MLATKSRPLSCQAIFSTKPVLSSSQTSIGELFYIPNFFHTALSSSSSSFPSLFGNSFHSLLSSSSSRSSFLTTASISPKSSLGLDEATLESNIFFKSLLTFHQSQSHFGVFRSEFWDFWNIQRLFSWHIFHERQSHVGVSWSEFGDFWNI